MCPCPRLVNRGRAGNCCGSSCLAVIQAHVWLHLYGDVHTASSHRLQTLTGQSVAGCTTRIPPGITHAAPCPLHATSEGDGPCCTERRHERDLSFSSKFPSWWGGGGGEKIKEKEKKRRMNHVLVRVGARRSNHCRCLRFDAGGRVPGEAGWWFLGTGRFFQRGWGI